MKYVRFYEEYATPAKKRKREANGNVTAIFPESRRVDLIGVFYEGVGALYDWPNSYVGGSRIDARYLRNCCRRIGEKRAREIHPALFEYLDKLD